MRHGLQCTLVHGATACIDFGAGMTLPAGSFYCIQSTGLGATSGHIGISFKMIDS